MAERKVHFTSTHTLYGVLSVPDESRKDIVILCHGGGTSTRESLINRDVAAGLERIGIASLRFDFTGHGESEGRPEEATIAQWVADIGAAARFLKEEGFRRFVLLGSSRGGSAALRAAAGGDLACLVLISPTSRFEDFSERPAAARACRAPTIIIQGDHDRSIPMAQSRDLCGMIPSCTLEVVKGADHNYTEKGTHEERVRLALGFIRGHL